MTPNIEITNIALTILKSVNKEFLNPSEINPDAPLTEEPLALDSIDFLEVVVAIEDEFNVKLESPEMTREHFKSLNTIKSFIESQK